MSDESHSGDRNISVAGNLNVGGDIIGGDKVEGDQYKAQGDIHIHHTPALTPAERRNRENLLNLVKSCP